MHAQRLFPLKNHPFPRSTIILTQTGKVNLKQLTEIDSKQVSSKSKKELSNGERSRSGYRSRRASSLGSQSINQSANSLKAVPSEFPSIQGRFEPKHNESSLSAMSEPSASFFMKRNASKKAKIEHVQMQQTSEAIMKKMKEADQVLDGHMKEMFKSHKRKEERLKKFMMDKYYEDGWDSLPANKKPLQERVFKQVFSIKLYGRCSSLQK